ncbi:MAG: cell division protein FtsL [Bacillota bacterium]
MAHKIKAYDYNESYYNSGKATNAPGLKKSTKAKLLTCVLVVTAFVLGLIFLSLSAQVAAKGQEINHLKKDIASLQTTNERLKLEKQKLSALDKIAVLAVNELGMKKPQFENLQMITVEEAEKTQALLAVHIPDESGSDNNMSIAGNKNFRSSIITAVSNIFSNWAVTGTK